MKAKDGKSYAEVTLRDVVENYYVSDFPMLAEIKRLYAENSMLRELENIRMTQVEHCETLTEDIEKLQAENAKLREYVTKLEQTNIVLESDNTDLLCDMEDMQFFISENKKLRKLLSSALIVAGFKGRQYLDTYLKEEEGTTLCQELKGLGIEADG